MRALLLSNLDVPNQLYNLPCRFNWELWLRFPYGKLAQMGNFSGLAMITWPFAGTLCILSAKLHIRGTTTVLAFCFRRWHSVHEVVTLLSF